MKNRLPGKLAVSPIGMGCMGFSYGYGQVPEESYSTGAIRKAHDFGCTFFDTTAGSSSGLDTTNSWLAKRWSLSGRKWC